jgi:hypothetical protein
MYNPIYYYNILHSHPSLRLTSLARVNILIGAFMGTTKRSEFNCKVFFSWRAFFLVFVQEKNNKWKQQQATTSTAATVAATHNQQRIRPARMAARATLHRSGSGGSSSGGNVRVVSSVLRFAALILIFGTTMGQKQGKQAAGVVEAARAEKVAAAAVNSAPGAALATFGIDLLNRVTPNATDENVFISPWQGD